MIGFHNIYQRLVKIKKFQIEVRNYFLLGILKIQNFIFID